MPAIDAVSTLRAASLRVTRPRTAVLTVLAGRPHADADTIATAVRHDRSLRGAGGRQPPS